MKQLVNSESASQELVQYIDETSGLPAELNQLKTAELLQDVQSYTLTIFSNAEQYDPLALAPDSSSNIVETYAPHSHLDPLESPSEIPNSTAPLIPLPTGIHPCPQDFEGRYGFNICYEALNATGATNSWTYSETLKQVFIKMNNVLMVQFKTGLPLENDRFFIRALLVYQNNDYANQAVCRCSIHWMEDDPMQLAHRTPRFCDCDNYNLAGHVLRCQTEGARYQFDWHSDRHSVIVGVPRSLQAGAEFIAVHYFFSCKTSCPRGMQRRGVQIIFTLEDESCAVYGRKVLPVKICSCPKRDKDRLERDLIKTSDQSNESGASSRKRPKIALMDDLRHIKTEKDQSSHTTVESLVSTLTTLVAKQEKELEIVNTLSQHVTALSQRHKEIKEVAALISSRLNSQPQV